MKQILISIKPEWTAKILSGEKTLEIRKTAPKEWVDYLNRKTDKKPPEPMTVFIYCTKGGGCITSGYTPSGKVYPYFPKGHSMFSGKVLAKFTLKKCELITVEGPWYDCFYQTETCTDDDLLRGSRLMGLEGYLKGCEGYAWHISDLEIFDEPKELSEFLVTKKYKSCYECPHFDYDLRWYCSTCEEQVPLERAPQSWCFVEENK